jgi:hypothetical protein
MTDDIGGISHSPTKSTGLFENSLTVPFPLTRLGVADGYSGQKVALQHCVGPQEIFCGTRKPELWNVPCPSFLYIRKLEPLVDGNFNWTGAEKAVTA